MLIHRKEQTRKKQVRLIHNYFYVIIQDIRRISEQMYLHS